LATPAWLANRPLMTHIGHLSPASIFVNVLAVRPYQCRLCL
jgi:hypothetical protein